MAEFSANDINEAKRRVRDMQSRARGFVYDSGGEEKKEPGEEKQSENNGAGLSDLFSNIFSSGDSSLILALVLILSREKADNMLILALLYILL